MSDKSVDRLIAICGRLASEFPGERATAAEMATRLLKELNLTWADVIRAGVARAKAPKWTPGSHVRICEHVWLKHFSRMTVWERGFIGGLLSRHRRSALTEAQ